MQNMNQQPRMTKQEAIDQLRREAEELESSAVSIKDYASNVRRAKMRRELANKLELELNKNTDCK